LRKNRFFTFSNVKNNYPKRKDQSLIFKLNATKTIKMTLNYKLAHFFSKSLLEAV